MTGAAKIEGSEGSETGTVAERDAAGATTTPFVQLNGKHEEDVVGVGVRELAVGPGPDEGLPMT